MISVLVALLSGALFYYIGYNQAKIKAVLRHHRPRDRTRAVADAARPLETDCPRGPDRQIHRESRPAFELAQGHAGRWRRRGCDRI